MPENYHQLFQFHYGRAMQRAKDELRDHPKKDLIIEDLRKALMDAIRSPRRPSGSETLRGILADYEDEPLPKVLVAVVEASPQTV